MKPRPPTAFESTWLRRIAASALMVTYVPGHDESYSLLDGTGVPLGLARRLIARGWLRGSRDGIFDQPQTYRALTVHR